MAKVDRAPLSAPFTVMEKLCVALVARSLKFPEIALRLNVTTETVKWHVDNASKKIPGDMPRCCKIIFWARGATLEQLMGSNWEPLSPSEQLMRKAEIEEEAMEEVPIY